MNIDEIKRLRSLLEAATEGDQPQEARSRRQAEFYKELGLPAARTLLALAEQHLDTFQQRVQPWMLACFGQMIASDREERNHRFLEEALELVQSTGCTASEAHQLVDYVYGRPVGEPTQEVGGVMVTLAALCLANGMDMHQCGETELARIWTKVDAIRAKQATKPKHSPLPAAPSAPSASHDTVWLDAWHALRDDVLSGIDGLDNDQVNIVLGMIDNYEPVGAQQHHVSVGLSEEQIDAVWNSMPGGPAAWLRNFGYQQFARAIIEANQPAAAPVAQMQFKCKMCSGHGQIGGLMPGDGGYHSEDCPECAGDGIVAAQALPVASDTQNIITVHQLKVMGKALTEKLATDYLEDPDGDSSDYHAGKLAGIMALWRDVEQHLAQSPAERAPMDAEQAARSKWTVKQWYEHVGAWENQQGEVCFGSAMALGAMLKLMAKARHAAQSASAPAGAVPAQTGTQGVAPTAQQERAWFKSWLGGVAGTISVDAVEFGRQAWAERARRASSRGA